MKSNKLEIQQAIIEIENPYPKDNFITDYKDFLKVRDFLKFYQFNLHVFLSLVNLTFELWESSQRINRLSLIQSIRNYGYDRESQSDNKSVLIFKGTQTLDTNKKLFSIFQDCFSSTCRLSYFQKKRIQNLCNSMLVNVSLGPEQEKWLCENTYKSPLILNRLLRYPKKSETISSWVTKNFEVDTYRNRRAEMISWIIDYNPQFIIDKQMLIDDFNYINSLDEKMVQDYIDDKEIDNQLNEDLKEVFSDNMPVKLYENDTDDGYSVKYHKRFYPVPLKFHQDYDLMSPDFVLLTEDFYDNIERNLKLTMIWGIAYSRVDDSVKTELLKKYYSEETYWSLLRVGKKYKLLDLLRWMLSFKE